ncbi:unnamed protein product [Periconia digitata]|uniref:Uncharacterized protein n=1 Tax=Periconia digitata TaxID=1303443 RepID=A0A9W4UST6_9PLEO|nr:unnamed protein product [Periconia digitata]
MALATVRYNLIVLVSFTISTLATPVVRRECGETCFNSTNECGAAFGGCWDDCVQQRPTFTAPLCPASIAETTSPATPTPGMTIAITSAHPLITPGPDPNSAAPTSGCVSGTTLCLDLLLECQGRNIMYGGCDDICSSKTYAAPPCSVTPVPTLWPGNETEALPTKAKGKVNRPPTTRTPCNPDKPRWMCAPLDW